VRRQLEIYGKGKGGGEMKEDIKSFIGRFLPATSSSFHYSMQKMLELYHENNKRQEDILIKLEEQENISKLIINALGELKFRTEDMNKEINAEKSRLESIKSEQDEISKLIKKNERLLNENLWANIFNSTISNSDWLRNKSFSPGRWAIGYPYLYVLYRALDEFKPVSILDLGLGETSRMIAQYASFKSKCNHYIVEHDIEWVSFFKNNYNLPERSKIVNLHLIEKVMGAESNVMGYDNFKETFKDNQFDLISIDGPCGNKAKDNCRIDVLDLIPENLSDSFVILSDDYHEDRVKNTVELLKDKLIQHRIPFSTGKYSGIKDLLVICSSDLKFLCSI
jgi:hypothetical protein